MPVYKIYLSPSNQTHNTGVNNYNEATFMHKLADKVRYHLTLSPMFNVRVSDIKMSLEQVAKDSDNFGAHLHICLHSDAGSPAAAGTTAFIYGKGVQAEKFAAMLYSKVSPLSPGKDRGIVVRPGLYELRKTKAPAVLIENFFHTNLTETNHFYEHIDEYAKAIAMAVYEMYDVPYPEPVRKVEKYKQYKDIIQSRCQFSKPDEVWELLDKHKYAEALYKKIAEAVSVFTEEK